MRKLFHKHITQRVKRLPRHFTKYLYERDTVFATLWVFAFIVLLGLIPINFYFFNPLKLALKDFDFNDINYSKLAKRPEKILDPRITILNVGHRDRAELAFLLDTVESFGPKVIGLDVTFDGPRDPEADSMLAAVLHKYPNIVIATRLNWEYEKDTAKFETKFFFGDVANKKGHVNLIGESIDEKRSVRYYSVYEKEKKKLYTSFGTSIIKEYDPAIYEELMARKKKSEILNYSRHTNDYWLVEPDSLYNGYVGKELFEGKIVLFGFVDENPNDIEDKVFTPMNQRIVGKTYPDMNGITVHANFISMVLDKDYIKTLPSWVNWLVAILIGWLHMSFFIRYYLESHIWFHLVAKLAQVLSAIFFVYLGMLLYDRFNIKLDMKYTLITIVLAVDVIYFYEAFAVWMHKKFHYHTVFHQKHH
jgi:CHASE2 domain-containing sensor protein